MNFKEYQEATSKTFQFSKPASYAPTGEHGQLIPLLGLTGEIGALLSEYKKVLRDGAGHTPFVDDLSEELGDVLWYVAAVAEQFGLNLEEIALKNLVKTNERWRSPSQCDCYDKSCDPAERLPTKFVYEFSTSPRKDGKPGVHLLTESGDAIGNPLSDNSHDNDGYRFHDVMHFAFVAHLGWSPVARQLLGKPRKDPKMAEVEDGGRAKVIDEAIVAMTFDYIGKKLEHTRGLRRIDSPTLHAIRALTRGYEVHARTEAEWEQAILSGFAVWRQAEENDGGVIVGDYSERKFEYRVRR